MNILFSSLPGLSRVRSDSPPPPRLVPSSEVRKRSKYRLEKIKINRTKGWKKQGKGGSQNSVARLASTFELSDEQPKTIIRPRARSVPRHGNPAHGHVQFMRKMETGSRCSGGWSPCWNNPWQIQISNDSQIQREHVHGKDNFVINDLILTSNDRSD